MKRENVDFFAIPDDLIDAHNRMMNWMRWVRVSPQTGWKEHPMWKQAISNSRQWSQPEYRENCDLLDAQAVELHVRKLRQDQRTAIRWYYISGKDPRGMARKLGMTNQRMFDIILQAIKKIRDIDAKGIASD